MAADHEARVLPELICQTRDVLLLGVPRQKLFLRGLHLIVIVGELLDSEQLEHDPGPACGGHFGGPAPDKSDRRTSQIYLVTFGLNLTSFGERR